MKVRIRIEQVDNGIVFRLEDVEEIEDPKNLVFDESEEARSIGREILDDIKCVMDAQLCNTVELEINYKPINGEQKPSDDEMKEALQTEYEKGRADAIAEMRKKLSDSKSKRQEVIRFLESLRLKED